MIDNSVISLYNEMYNKLKFYEDRIDIKDNIDNINFCLSEMLISNNDDYELWKDSIKEEMKLIMDKLPYDYEYEISEAKKLIRK